jgi:hypothetical protein
MLEMAMSKIAMAEITTLAVAEKSRELSTGLQSQVGMTQPLAPSTTG